MSTTDDREPFAGLHPPRPPERLQERVLCAAARALDEEPPSAGDRLWANRPLRRAWAAMTAALLAGHVWLTFIPAPPRPTRAGIVDEADDTLREALLLPSGRVSARAAEIALGSGRSRKRVQPEEAS